MIMKDLTLTHSAGEITWRAYGEAFGRMVVDTGIAPVSTIATVNNLRFPGQLEDQETGTFYNYFRDYDPATGRYIESDPIGLSGGTNTYGYVDDNPLNYVDPDGKVGLAGCIAATLIAYGAYKV